MVYLNQAGTSWPKPAPVRAAVAAALDASAAEWPALFAQQHARVARAFGAAPEALLLTPGCTSALAVAVADLPWRSGERALCSGFEHHALQRPLRKLAERGVETTVVGPTSETIFDLERLERELSRGRVRLVAVSAASNITGDLLPLRDITRLAHERDALVLVDAAQVAGWSPLDVVDLDADLLAFAGHKALHGPWGIGGLFIAPHVEMDAPAAACELPLDAASPAPDCGSRPGYCDVGSVDRVALAGLSAALDWLDAPEQGARLERARELVAHLERGVAELPGAALHAFAPAAQRLPTVALTLEGSTPAQLARRLAAGGVVAAGGLACAPLAHATLGTDPAGVLRISLGPSNGVEDLERALTLLRGD